MSSVFVNFCFLAEEHQGESEKELLHTWGGISRDNHNTRNPGPMDPVDSEQGSQCELLHYVTELGYCII